MAAIGLVLGDMVDDDRLTAFADFMANRGFDLQLAAGLQAEIDVVQNPAGDPAFAGDPGDRGKPHACGAADDIEDGWHGIDARNGIDVGLKVMSYFQGPRAVRQVYWKN